MADSRHFENSFIFIPQTLIIRFRPNLVCRCDFPFWDWSVDEKSKFCTQDGNRTHLQNR